MKTERKKVEKCCGLSGKPQLLQNEQRQIPSFFSFFIYLFYFFHFADEFDICPCLHITLSIFRRRETLMRQSQPQSLTAIMTQQAK